MTVASIKKPKLRFKRQPSKTSKEIISFLESGISQESLVKQGYKESTVRYWYRKMYRPQTFKRFVKQVHGYNKKRKANAEAV